MICLELFLSFLKIGAFTFGGGYAMLPLVQSEVVSRGWMENADIVNFIAVSESTPGPFAVNMSTYVGMTVGGFLGAVCATVGVVLPSFLIILIVARCFARFQSSKLISGCMAGLKPAVIGLIGAAVFSVGRTVFFPEQMSLSVLSEPLFYVSLGIFLLMTLLSFKKIHPILIICLSAAIGIGFGYLFEF